MNLKLFNLMSGVNETKVLVQHKSCDCNGRLNGSEDNMEQKWNHDECRCKCKQLDYWNSCKHSDMCNPSTCDCEECNKVSKIDEYIDEKGLIGKLVS